jgi:hypothetical protein
MTGLLGDLTMEELSKLRRMSVVDAQLFLSHRGVSLTPDERERALALAGRDRMLDAPQSPATNIRRNWMTAAWLLGASFRQLGTLHDIAPQTAVSIIDRAMKSKERSAIRLAQGMSLEALSAFRARYNESLETLTGMTPLEIAQWLLDNTELDI